VSSTRTIAFDANPAARPVATGTETYARALLRRLPAAAPDLRFRFFAARPADLGVDLTVLPGRRPWSQVRLPIELWQRRPDLFFAPAHVVPFLAPGPTLTVVHDLAFDRHPAAYSPGARAYLRLTTRWAVRRCPLLIAVSQATARDLTDLYRLPPSRVRVVPNGGGEDPAAAPDESEVDRRLLQLQVPRPYLLHVGRVERRKNQLTALRAVERLPDLPLVCAGPVADAALATRLASSPRCRLLGRVAADDLEALYAGAEALVFPSLYEGFGLPVLEAMRRGLPVVTAAVSALPEVGGEAAVYVDDPTDPDQLAAAVERALADRPRLVELGLRQAARFTWDRTAQGVAAVIRELVG
jgi:glycosyltransferase involved in cell wall biosynthesis